MRSIGLIAEKLLAPALSKQNLHIKKIIFNWESIVGEDLAKFTAPMKIMTRDGKGLLYISTSNSAVGTSLFYIKDAIMAKISTFIGKEAIEDIKIILQPASSPEPVPEDTLTYTTPDISSITDSDLQINLAKLFNCLKN